MVKALNYGKVKKTYFPVTFPDEKTTILVGTPTKAIMDDLKLLEDRVDENEESEDSGELYAACAKIMSRNKTGTKITREYLESVFDFEDIVIFFNHYKEFLSEVLAAKN